MAAAVDTGVRIGMADTDDEHHGVGMDIVRGIDYGELPTGRVTNYILLETLNWIHDRKRHEKAVETYDRLHQSAGFEILNPPQKDFTEALELFETYANLSFGAATIAAYMQRTGVEYLYSFDDDFDGIEWVTRLDTADHPFN
jgi:predicted nucleic acid-binding protein